MPIQDFLMDKEFKNLLKESIVYPKVSNEMKVLIVPPVCDDPSLVGTAFEFLLQYELFRYQMKTSHNLGLYSSSLMLGDKKPQLIYKTKSTSEGNEKSRELKLIRYVPPSYIGASRISMVNDSKKENEILEFYNYAKNFLKKYDRDLSFEKVKMIPDEIFIIAIKLSKLEQFYRSGKLARNFDYISDKDINDLKALIKIFDRNKLDAERYCLCGPYFASKGIHVSGFDMDLVLDNTIVDIKTTSSRPLIKSHVYQLVIYYLLSKVFGIEGYPVKQRIERIAIYYVRYDYMWSSDIKDLLDPKGEVKLKKWIRARVVSDV